MCAGRLLHLSAFVTALTFGSGAAIAQPCSAPDFQTVRFSDIRDLSSYAFLSTVSEGDYKKNEQKFKGEMTIPYINVPASGDFQQMKAQLQQVQRMTQINLNKNHTETLLDITWGQLGLEAYRACLNAQKGEAVIIEHLQGSDPFSNELIVSLTWQHRKHTEPKPIEQIICLGCDYSRAKEGDLVEPGNSYLLQLNRHAETNLSFVVTVDGLVGQFHLPKPPKPPIIAEENWTILAQATQPNSAQQLILPHKVFCWPSPPGDFIIETGPKDFTLGKRQEFIVGSARALKTGEGGPLGYAREPIMLPQTEKQVCWLFEVVSQYTKNGFSGTYNLSVKTVAPAD